MINENHLGDQQNADFRRHREMIDQHSKGWEGEELKADEREMIKAYRQYRAESFNLLPFAWSPSIRSGDETSIG